MFSLFAVWWNQMNKFEPFLTTKWNPKYLQSQPSDRHNGGVRCGAWVTSIHSCVLMPLPLLILAIPCMLFGGMNRPQVSHLCLTLPHLFCILSLLLHVFSPRQRWPWPCWIQPMTRTQWSGSRSGSPYWPWGSSSLTRSCPCARTTWSSTPRSDTTTTTATYCWLERLEHYNRMSPVSLAIYAELDVAHVCRLSVSVFVLR